MSLEAKEDEKTTVQAEGKYSRRKRRANQGATTYGNEERVAAVVKKLAERRRGAGAPGLLAVDVVWTAASATESTSDHVARTERLVDPDADGEGEVSPARDVAAGKVGAEVLRGESDRGALDSIAHGQGGVVDHDYEEADEGDHVGGQPAGHEADLDADRLEPRESRRAQGPERGPDR